MGGAEEQRAIIDSELYWFGGIGGGCLDRPTPEHHCHGDAVSPSFNEVEKEDIDDGYEVRLDVKTGEIQVVEIRDGQTVEPEATDC